MTSAVSARAHMDFELPPSLEAVAPPEERGRGRDDVRLMETRRSSGLIAHHTFQALPDLLRPGDLLVVNTSATIAAAIRCTVAGEPALLHLAGSGAGGQVVELRHPDPSGRGSTPWLDAECGTVVNLPDGATAQLLEPAGRRFGTGARVRLWSARLALPMFLDAYLGAHGRPISYGYVSREQPLSVYQTIFALEPGSAEMPSAARPFTPELVTRLVALGIGVVPVVLHCGVSSPETGEPPQPEWFQVPAATAASINASRRSGGWIVAVGTTSVRAVESATGPDGRTAEAHGWTDLVVGPGQALRSVHGMITGWHEPRSSHLAMLEAVAGRPLLETAYQAALDNGYLWHEFGDSHLILP